MLSEIKARRGLKDPEEEKSVPMNMYLEDSFKAYFKEKYAVVDPQVIENETIL